MNIRPLPIVLIVAAVTCAFCWIASLLTKDTSWVDRVWSVVPVVYVWIFAGTAIASGEESVRLVVMAVLAVFTMLTSSVAMKLPK